MASGDRKKAHNCPDCTHLLCEKCGGIGYVVQSEILKHGDITGHISRNVPCPNGCPPPVLIN